VLDIHDEHETDHVVHIVRNGEGAVEVALPVIRAAGERGVRGAPAGLPRSASPSLPRGAAAGRAWARLAQAAERTRSTLLVVGAARQAGAFAALGLDLGPHRARWSGGRGRLLLLDGVTARVTVARSRAGGLGRALVVQHAACA